MVGEENGGSGLRAHQLLCTPPSYWPPGPPLGSRFHSAPSLLWGHSRALTAVPGHRPLGGAVAPPTQAGGTGWGGKAETLPNPAWRGGTSALAGSPQSACLSYFRASRVQARPRPHFGPCGLVSPASGGLWLSDPPSRSRVEVGGWGGRAGCRGGWGRVAPSLCSLCRLPSFLDPGMRQSFHRSRPPHSPLPPAPVKSELRQGQRC